MNTISFCHLIEALNEPVEKMELSVILTEALQKAGVDTAGKMLALYFAGTKLPRIGKAHQRELEQTLREKFPDATVVVSVGSP